jgi:hypothetical protein
VGLRSALVAELLGRFQKVHSGTNVQPASIHSRVHWVARGRVVAAGCTEGVGKDRKNVEAR